MSTAAIPRSMPERPAPAPPTRAPSDPRRFADVFARAEQARSGPARAGATPGLAALRPPTAAQPGLGALRGGRSVASAGPTRARPLRPAASPPPAGAAPTVARPATPVVAATRVPTVAAAATSAVLPSATNPLPLTAFPRPAGDNGRGMHWIPTTSSSPEVVDTYVEQAKGMGVKWMVVLNDGTNVGQNDYLVKKLAEAGIEPVMRVYTPHGQPIGGDLEGMVRHYVGLGVHYFQPYNEPNLKVENPDGRPNVERYVTDWLAAAKQIVKGGGLPGFGALSPGGDLNDEQFLRQALDSLRRRGELGALDKAWLSMHNYTLNVPVDASADGGGFWKFRTYHRLLRDALGRDMPIVGTEGGTFVGDQQDKSWPAVSASSAVDSVRQAYRYMRDEREPWNFAYSYWVIANEAGGGSDPAWSRQALFRADGSTSPVVAALKGLG